MSRDADAVVSDSGQKEKQNYDSACGASQSPEKQDKEDAKKPTNPSGPRPHSYPRISTAGNSVKSDGDSAKPRPQSYPSALSRCIRGRATRAPSAVSSLGPTGAAADLAQAEPECRHFSWMVMDYTHGISNVAQSVEILPRQC